MSSLQDQTGSKTLSRQCRINAEHTWAAKRLLGKARDAFSEMGMMLSLSKAEAALAGLD